MWTNWGRVAALSAFPFVLLVAAATANQSTLSSDSSGAKVISYYASHRGAEHADVVLIGLAVFVGFFFFGSVRSFLRSDPQVEWLAAVGFAGAIVFGMGALVESGSLFALSDRPSQLGTATAYTLNLVPTLFTPVTSGVGVAGLLCANGLAILRSRLLPAWLAWFGIVAGIVALVPWIEFIGLWGVGVWTLAAGYLIYRHQPHPQEATPLTAPTSG
jgi:hypothetical protein